MALPLARSLSRRLLKQCPYIKRGERVRVRGHAPFYATLGFTQGEFSKFSAFTALVRQRPLWIVDAISGMDCNRIAAIIRQLCRKHGTKLVVLDYLQKIKPASKQEKRTYEVGEVSGILKSLAVETGAAFLTLAQLCPRSGQR